MKLPSKPFKFLKTRLSNLIPTRVKDKLSSYSKNITKFISKEAPTSSAAPTSESKLEKSRSFEVKRDSTASSTTQKSIENLQTQQQKYGLGTSPPPIPPRSSKPELPTRARSRPVIERSISAPLRSRRNENEAVTPLSASASRPPEPSPTSSTPKAKLSTSASEAHLNQVLELSVKQPERGVYNPITNTTSYTIEVDGKLVKVKDCRAEGAHSYISNQSFQEGLKSSFDTLMELMESDFLPKETKDELLILNEIFSERLKTQIHLDPAKLQKGDKEGNDHMKAECELGTEILGEFITRATNLLSEARGTPYTPRDLQRDENLHSAKNFHEVVTIYTVEGRTLVESAVPGQDDMYTCGTRDRSDKVSNHFRRQVSILDENGEVRMLSSVDTHSSLPSIYVGEMVNPMQGQTSRNVERYQATCSNFEQVIRSQAQDAINNGASAEDMTLPINVTTLFTAAIGDKALRKMDSETMQLEETAFAYDKYDGKPIEITILDSEGHRKTITVKPDIEHVNMGTNIHAMDEGPKYSIINKHLENKVDDKGIAKLSRGVSKELANSPFKGIVDRSHIDEIAKGELNEVNQARINVDLVKISTKGKLKDLYTKLDKLGSNDEAEFKKLKEEIEVIHDEIKAAYTDVIKAERKLFKKTKVLEVKLVQEKRRHLIKNSDNYAPETIKAMERDIDLHQLVLDVRELYYDHSFSKQSNNHNLQTAILCLAKVRGRRGEFFCKSGCDRTGEEANRQNAAAIARDVGGTYPAFSNLFKSDPQVREATRFYNDKKVINTLHHHGVSNLINAQNRPGSPGLQVGLNSNQALNVETKTSAATFKNKFGAARKNSKRMKQKPRSASEMKAREEEETVFMMERVAAMGTLGLIDLEQGPEFSPY